MLNLNQTIDSAYIYLIICGGGPGTETFTADAYSPADRYVAEMACSMRREGESEATIAEWVAGRRHEMTLPDEWIDTEGGLFTINAMYADEGPVYILNKPMKLGVLLKEVISFEQLASEDPSLAFMSTIYRAIVNNWNRSGEKVWSSVGGWRNPDCELMPKWQIERLMELFNLTREELLTCDDPVLRLSAQRSVKEYRGC